MINKKGQQIVDLKRELDSLIVFSLYKVYKKALECDQSYKK